VKYDVRRSADSVAESPGLWKSSPEKRSEIAGDSIRFLPEAGEILLIPPDSVDRGKRKASW